jgi:hypothetical protein
MSDWDITDRWDEGIKREEMREKALLRNVEYHNIAYKRVTALDDLCPVPKENEQWRIITEHPMNAYVFIVSLLNRGNIKEIYLSTFRMNKPTVDNIIEKIENGRIEKANFIINQLQGMSKTSAGPVAQLKEYCDNRANAKMVYTNIHAKVFIAQTQGGAKYVFEGSGNLTDNGRIEQYLYERNSQVYDFHKNWMNEVLSNCSQ